MGFELRTRDAHIAGEGPHIGLTHPHLNESVFDKARGTLINSGYRVEDGGVSKTPRGAYAELAVDHPLTEEAERELRRLGCAGVGSTPL